MITPEIIQGLSLSYCVVIIALTSFRLFARGPSRWWWDDLCATIGMVAYIIQTCILWLIQTTGLRFASVKGRIAAFYLNSLTFYIEDWFARLAILYSIIRISPSPDPRRKLHLLAIPYFSGMFTNMGLLLGICQSNTSWQKQVNMPVCLVAKSIPIYQIVAGILSDLCLIFLAITTLMQLTSAPILRRRLQIIFSTSILLTIACILQSSFAITDPGIVQIPAGLTEGFVALVVCNLAVTAIGVMHLAGYNTGAEPTARSNAGETVPQNRPRRQDSSIRFHHSNNEVSMIVSATTRSNNTRTGTYLTSVRGDVLDSQVSPGPGTLSELHAVASAGSNGEDEKSTGYFSGEPTPTADPMPPEVTPSSKPPALLKERRKSLSFDASPSFSHSMNHDLTHEDESEPDARFTVSAP